MRKLILAVAVVLLLGSIPLVVSQPFCDQTGAGEFGIAPGWVNPFHILIAYDEEMSAVNHEYDGRMLHAKMYSLYQVSRAIYYYPFPIKVKGFTAWDSEDCLNTTEMLFEAIEELNWFSGVVRDDGVRYDILVLWTVQINDNVGGAASRNRKACIAKTQNDWIMDDNLSKHELGHVFRLSHCTEHCGMNNVSGQYYTWYDEPLEPIESGHRTIAYFGWQYHAYMVYEWCMPHWMQLRNIADMLHTYLFPSVVFDKLEAGEEVDVDQEPYTEDVPDAIKQNPYRFVILALIVLAIIALVIVAVYIYKRRHREKKE